MQLGAAAVFAVTALSSVIAVFAFFNHDTFVRVLRAQGTTIPRGTTIDEMASLAIGIGIATVVVIVILYLVAAVGSFLGWRWIFWAALVLFAFDAIGALTNLGSFAKPDASPVPVGYLVVNELLSIAGLAMFIWMLVGVIKFGPWAMKKPGS
jgi:hypothetical protein